MPLAAGTAVCSTRSERERSRTSMGRPTHDWRHVERVDRLAVTLAAGTDADDTVLRVAVSLHDIGREREARGEIDDHARWGSERAGEILREIGCPKRS